MSDAQSPAPPGPESAILDALRAVADPCCRERGLSVVDMGLLRRLEVTAGTARVDLLLTSGWCPFQVDLLAEVTAAVESVPGVHRADVHLVLDEVWTPDRLSPGARRQLRFLPDPAQVPDRTQYLATAGRAAPDTRRDP